MSKYYKTLRSTSGGKSVTKLPQIITASHSKSSFSSTHSARGDRNIILHPIDTRFQSLMTSQKRGDSGANNNRYGAQSVLINDDSPLDE